MDFPIRQVLPILGLIACWIIGGLLYICGFAIYMFKYLGRGVATEIKAGSLPVATFLLRAATVFGVIGILFGFVEWWQIRH